MASCDKDFNEIGGDLLGDNNFELNKQSFGVSGYNQKNGVVQSNNLDVNLGIYNSTILVKLLLILIRNLH
jgi:hypothetical protein